MTQTILGEIDLVNINDLFQQIVGEYSEIAICDLSGELADSSHESLGSEIQDAVQQARTSSAFNPLLTGLQKLTIADDRQLYYQTISTTSAGPFGYLVTLSHASKILGHSVIDAAFTALGTLIESQYVLTQELNEMAEELIERHEELNLIYSLDEHIKQYDCSEGLGTLKKIIDDCLNFLSVDAVILNLPGDGIHEMVTTTDCFNSLPDLHEDWARIKSNLLVRLKSIRRPLVINKPSDIEYHNANMHGQMKLASVPIVDVQSEVVGLLAVVSGPQRSKFTNSDRKLLEILSKQVSLIIQSDYDSLTGLLNRPGFEKKLQSAFDYVHNNVVLLVNVDQFSVINDRYGRIAGEELLKQVAVTIEKSTRDSDSVARIIGSEFSVLLGKCPNEVALNVGLKLLEAIQESKFCWEGTFFDITACAGMISLDRDKHKLDEVINLAHSSCEVAKNKGSGQIYQYDKNDPALAEYHGRLEWVSIIQKALRDNDFKLYAQPIAPLLEKDNAFHFEVLLRLLDDQGNVILPCKFIGPAEDYKLMPKIDRWVIENTLRQLSNLPTGYFPDGVMCSINLSGQSFSDSRLKEFIESQCLQFDIPPQWICFEVTETVAIANFSEAVNFIHRLKEKGFSFALDDFGTGLSSFSYLNNLPVDYLKIDGEFVRDIHENEVHLVMVSAINRIGHVMGLKTIAEFVENQEIIHRLTEMGIDFAQGYELGRPIPMDELLAELSTCTKARAVAAR